MPNNPPIRKESVMSQKKLTRPKPAAADGDSEPGNAADRAERISAIARKYAEYLEGRTLGIAEHEEVVGWNITDEIVLSSALDPLEDNGEWLIERYLPSAAVGHLVARDQSFKSFLALHAALHVATGKDYHGHPVRRARVLYICAEGKTGIAKRKVGWEQEHNGGAVVPDSHFHVLKRAPNLFGGKHLRQLVAYVREQRIGLIVVDTLNKVSGDANENTAEMAEVIAHIAEIQRATPDEDGTALVLHHTQRDDKDSRGHSSIEDGVDFVFSLQRSGTSLAATLRCVKMKDDEDGWAESVVLEKVPLQGLKQPRPARGGVRLKPPVDLTTLVVREVGGGAGTGVPAKWSAGEAVVRAARDNLHVMPDSGYSKTDLAAYADQTYRKACGDDGAPSLKTLKNAISDLAKSPNGSPQLVANKVGRSVYFRPGATEES